MRNLGFLKWCRWRFKPSGM